MTDVTFEDHGDDYLPCYRRRPGETTPLLAFVALDLLNGIATFAYGDDAEIIDAENRGELVRFPFDPRVRGRYFPTIVRKVLPLLQIVQNGYRGMDVSDDDDGCLRAVFNEAGQAAVNRIDDWLDELIYEDQFVIAAIWEPEEYVRDRVLDNHEIDAATTNDRLDELDGEYRQAAEDEGVHIAGELLPWLIDVRDQLRDEAASRSGPTAPADAVP
jgi:hypothetical protein